MKTREKPTVDDYIARLAAGKREIAVALRGIVEEAAPRAVASIKWGGPWWEHKGYLCLLYEAGDHVNFGFARGTELDDPHGLLEGTGKGMRHIKVRSASEIKRARFAALVRQAVRLNEAGPARHAKRKR